MYMCTSYYTNSWYTLALFNSISYEQDLLHFLFSRLLVLMQ